MKHLRFACLILLFLFPYRSLEAKVFTFTPPGGVTFTVTTDDRQAVISVSDQDTFSKRVYLAVWKDRNKTNTVTGELIATNNLLAQKEIGLSGTPPRTGTLGVTGLTPNTTYYLSINDRPTTAPYAFTTDASYFNVSGQKYSVSFDPSGTTLKATVLGPNDLRELWLIFTLQDVGFGAGNNSISPSNTIKKEVLIGSLAPSGKRELQITDLAPGVSYYASIAVKKAVGFELVSDRSVKIVFGTQEKLYYKWPLDISTDSETTTIKGAIDKEKHPDYSGFKVSLETSPSAPFSPDPSSPGPADKKFAYSKTDLKTPIKEGVHVTTGEYYWTLSALTPSSAYYFRQTITAPSGKTDIQVGKFDTKNGQILPGSDLEANLFEKRSYRLLAPFPGLAVLLDPELCMEMLREGKKVPSICSEEDPSSFNGFLNYFFKLLIGLAAVLLVLRIIFEGYKYITTDIPFMKTNAKSNLLQALLGLGLALSAYLILNTINPKLVENTITIRGINLVIPYSEGHQYRLTQTQSGPGSAVFKKTKYYEKIKTISAQYNIPHCLLQVAIQRESGGVDGLIGHDENAASVGVDSRKNFVNSGKKYTGQTFTPDQGLVTKGSFLNDDHKSGSVYTASNPSAPDLGLDWRFSHGIGLFQVTFFPKGAKYGDYTKGIYVEALKKNVFPRDMFDSTTSLAVAASMVASRYKECGGNIDQTFRGYVGGKCNKNNPFLDKEVPIRVGLYNQCAGQSGGAVVPGASSGSTTGTKTILALGDSLTAPATWTTTFMVALAKQHTDWAISNQAVGGDSTIAMLKIAKRIELEGKRYNVVTVLGGTNDILSGYSRQYNYKITERNLDSIIKIAKKVGDKVIVISPPYQTKNVYPAFTTLAEQTADLEALNAYLRAYPGVEYIDFYTVTKNKPSLISDGVHPSAAGHKALLNLVSEKLK